MKLHLLSGILALTSALALGASASFGGEDAKKEIADGKVALADVPAVVKAAAEKAVPKIVLTEAEKITKGKNVYYELCGKAGDKEYEILVTAAGKVLSAELDDDDDAGSAGKDGKKGPDDKKPADDKKPNADQAK